MAISREEAIKELNTENCVDCAVGSSSVPTTKCKWDCKYKDSVIKAISDMEKLQKIEKAFGTSCLSDDTYSCKYDGDCFRHQIEVIEQILKEVE